MAAEKKGVKKEKGVANKMFKNCGEWFKPVESSSWFNNFILFSIFGNTCTLAAEKASPSP